MTKLRPVGKVLLDMEPLLEELTDDHELQRGEILGLILSWMDIHRPDCVEKYLDGSLPNYYYGPKQVKEE